MEKKPGIGVVLRDSRGLVIASCSKVVHQALGVYEVKAMVATWALSFASDVGVKWAMLEGDSKAVILGLREDGMVFVPYGLLLEDVRILSQQFDELRYQILAHSLIG